MKSRLLSVLAAALIPLLSDCHSTRQANYVSSSATTAEALTVIAIGDPTRPGFDAGLQALRQGGVEAGTGVYSTATSPKGRQLIIVPRKDVERAQLILKRDEFKEAFSAELPDMKREQDMLAEQMLSQLTRDAEGEHGHH